MTQVAPLIDLGAMGEQQDVSEGWRLPSYWRRTLVAATAEVVCLLVLGASAPGRPVLGEPLWTGQVSLNGFSLGPDSLYRTTSGGTAVVSQDVVTGRQRWSLDLTELPDTTVDLGAGLVAVLTRRLGNNEGEFSGAPEETIRFVRAGTGQEVGQTSGFLYGTSVPGLPVLVLRDRSRTAEGCADLATQCVDATAWRLSGTGVTVAWRVSLPAGTRAMPTYSGDRTDGLLEMNADGTMRLRDLASGAVSASTDMSAEDQQAGTALVTHDAVMTARRDLEHVVVTAYARPSLRTLWSVRLPADPVLDNVRGGWVSLTDCGPQVCLDADGRTSQRIDLATGAVTPPMVGTVILRLGAGFFLAGAPMDATSGQQELFVVDRRDQILARYPGASLIWWTDSDGRALLSQPGVTRTGFVMIDGQGQPHTIGSVSGALLRCDARADILACSDGGGTLRVWRLPV